MWATWCINDPIIEFFMIHGRQNQKRRPLLLPHATNTHGATFLCSIPTFLEEISVQLRCCDDRSYRRRDERRVKENKNKRVCLSSRSSPLTCKDAQRRRRRLS